MSIKFETIHVGSILNGLVIAQFTFGDPEAEFNTVYSPGPNEALITNKFLACGEYGVTYSWEVAKALWRLSTKQYNFKPVKIKTLEELLQK